MFCLETLWQFPWNVLERLACKTILHLKIITKSINNTLSIIFVNLIQASFNLSLIIKDGSVMFVSIFFLIKEGY